MAGIYQRIILFIRRIGQSEFLLDGYALTMIGIGVVMNGALWVYLNRTIDPEESFVALHFTYAFGVNLIGSSVHLYDAPYYAALFSVLNIALARIIYGYDILIAYVLLSALPLMNAVMIFNSVMVTTTGSF